ncbi:MAG: flavodoxin family protein [Dehalococcoidia bacterium]|nr:flavodoxin family protein [Dehalococcoidia bacterium]
MKKVTAFIGTETRRGTYRAVQEFEKGLLQHGEVDFEYVFLSDYHLEFCRGCKMCFDKGEQYCPLKDDRDVLLQKMELSDGVVLATPNYAFHVSARMKNLLDRIAFINHRPRFFGKPCTAIVTQGIFGGGAIVKYLCSAARYMGFRTASGCCVNTLEPMTEQQEKSLVRKTRKAADTFYKELNRATPPPSFGSLMMFRLSRTSIKNIDHDFRDYQHFRDKGWFESDYYHDTRLGPVKKMAGGLFDLMAQLMVRLRQARQPDSRGGG